MNPNIPQVTVDDEGTNGVRLTDGDQTWHIVLPREVSGQAVADRVNAAIDHAYEHGQVDGRVEGVASVTPEQPTVAFHESVSGGYYLRIDRASYYDTISLPESYSVERADEVARFIRGALADANLTGQNFGEAQAQAEAQQAIAGQPDVPTLQRLNANQYEMIQELTNSLTEAREGLNVMTIERDGYIQSLNERTEQRDALSESVHQLRQELEATQAQRDELDRVLTAERMQSSDERVAEANQRISNFESAILQHEQRAERFETTIGQLREAIRERDHDMEIVADEFIEEAERRDWCSEYEQFVERVNPRLTHGALHVRSQDWTFDVTLSMTVTINRSEDIREVSENIGRAIERYVDNYHPGDYSYSCSGMETDSHYEA